MELDVFEQRLAGGQDADEVVTLPWERRVRSRQRVQLDGRGEALLALPRGMVLRGGDMLTGAHGRRLRIVAAEETVSTAHASDAAGLLRAAYHLGNRHVAVQIGAAWLRYLHDHVLDDMLRGLGLHVVVGQAPFEPEAGAYAAGHGHGHGHD
jgi:urease accessory protein